MLVIGQDGLYKGGLRLVQSFFDVLTMMNLRKLKMLPHFVGNICCIPISTTDIVSPNLA
jgi:hypothetical protein